MGVGSTEVAVGETVGVVGSGVWVVGSGVTTGGSGVWVGGSGVAVGIRAATVGTTVGTNTWKDTQARVPAAEDRPVTITSGSPAQRGSDGKTKEAVIAPSVVAGAAA